MSSKALRVWSDQEESTLRKAHDFGVPKAWQKTPWAWFAKQFFNSKYSGKQISNKAYALGLKKPTVKNMPGHGKKRKAYDDSDDILVLDEGKTDEDIIIEELQKLCRNCGPKHTVPTTKGKYLLFNRMQRASYELETVATQEGNFLKVISAHTSLFYFYCLCLSLFLW